MSTIIKNPVQLDAGITLKANEEYFDSRVYAWAQVSIACSLKRIADALEYGSEVKASAEYKAGVEALRRSATP